MQLRKATRQQAKIRLGLSATSGAGKTYSALLIAFGLCGDYEKVAIIDTENGSADLYAHLGGYNVITLTAPFTPEKYIAAIKVCEDSGMSVIIVDSITHEWEELLKISGAMTGNSYTNWSKITPRHDAFIQSILQSKCHVLTTVRRKQDYEMGKDSSGKGTVTKLGLKEVTRDGFEYEVTVNLELDVAHFATSSKDRTGLFSGQPQFIPSIETGKLLKAWCESGAEPITPVDPRPVLQIATPEFNAVYDAVVNKGYTKEQVEIKYQVADPVWQIIADAVNAKAIVATIPDPAPAPVTQAQIHEANVAYVAPVIAAPLNGRAVKPRPF
jgi:hypothetical protein